MKLKHFLSLAYILFLIACKQPKKINSNAFSDEIIKAFNGDLAYETTAFVEKYWRVVGNTGFNESIYHIAEQLEKSGYISEDKATNLDLLTYRIETRPLKRPTWESVDATVSILNEEIPLLSHRTNRNMIAMNSHSTPKEGVTAEVVYIKDITNIEPARVKGKIVFAETHPSKIYKAAVVEGEAVGLITYNNPGYLQPEKNINSIQFRSIPHDSIRKSWGIALSYQANERLKKRLTKGRVELNVKVDTKIYPSEELTIVADIKGSDLPEERLVFSAHVQEPGANDNASGVGVALEMAKVSANLFKEGRFNPKRTLTFLWGDEIISTRRYVQEDTIRAKGIKWGISLDMVGENTEVTGGTFLIEKMPDPSAIWTRGKDRHTEWGGRPLGLKDMTPHYLNDFVFDKFLEQGKRANWVVKTNPFEGGSDHVPFLREAIPSVLFWHFTDQFYHTDNDRIDKVSKATLKNVGTASLISAFELLNSDTKTAKSVLSTIQKSAENRLKEELKQSQIALKNGDSLQTQIDIISAWEDWYLKTASTTLDMVSDSTSIRKAINRTQQIIRDLAKECLEQIN